MDVEKTLECVECGSRLVPGAKFCGKCGAPVPEDAVAVEPPAVADESRPKTRTKKRAVTPAASDLEANSADDLSGLLEDGDESGDVYLLVADEESDNARASRFFRPAVAISIVLSIAAYATVGYLGVQVVDAMASGDTTPDRQATVSSSSPEPVPTATQAATPILGGWETPALWKATLPSDNATVSGDGALVAVADGRTFTILNATTGDTATTVATDATVLPRRALVGDAEALVSWSATELVVATPLPGAGDAANEGDSHALPTDAGDGSAVATVHRIPSGYTATLRGDRIVLVADSDRTGDTQILTSTGLVSPTPPIKGAALLGVGDKGTFLWATKSGDIVVATAKGKKRDTVALAPPANKATVSRWLGVTGDTVVTVWKRKGGDAVLVTHSVATGKIGDKQNIDKTDADDVTLRISQNRTTVFVGDNFITFPIGFITPTTFTPLASVGARWFGHKGNVAGYFDTDATFTRDAGANVTPLGEATGGSLVVLGDNHLRSYSAVVE